MKAGEKGITFQNPCIVKDGYSLLSKDRCWVLSHHNTVAVIRAWRSTDTRAFFIQKRSWKFGKSGSEKDSSNIFINKIAWGFANRVYQFGDPESEIKTSSQNKRVGLSKFPYSAGFQSKNIDNSPQRLWTRETLLYSFIHFLKGENRGRFVRKLRPTHAWYISV